MQLWRADHGERKRSTMERRPWLWTCCDEPQKAAATELPWCSNVALPRSLLRSTWWQAMPSQTARAPSRASARSSASTSSSGSESQAYHSPPLKKRRSLSSRLGDTDASSSSDSDAPSRPLSLRSARYDLEHGKPRGPKRSGGENLIRRVHRGKRWTMRSGKGAGGNSEASGPTDSDASADDQVRAGSVASDPNG